MDNPLQKYVDIFNKRDSWVQPALTAEQAQYLIDTLDLYDKVLRSGINGTTEIDRKFHDNLCAIMVDIIMYQGMKEEINGKTDKQE